MRFRHFLSVQIHNTFGASVEYKEACC